MKDSEVLRITCEELKRLKDAGDKILLIDTRPAGAYSAGHIQGAININYDESADPMTRDFMLSTLPDDALLVPYCD
jgi:rhodanese-related sulfurtransferase